MEQNPDAARAEKIRIILELRAFARVMIRLAAAHDATPPLDALKILEASPEDFYDGQHRGPLNERRVLRIRQKIDDQYNANIAERYGFSRKPSFESN